MGKSSIADKNNNNLIDDADYGEAHVVEILNKLEKPLLLEQAKHEVEKISHKFTSKQWIAITTLAVCNFAIGACISLQAPFYPREAAKKGVHQFQCGMVFSVYQLSVMVSSPIIERLVPKIAPNGLLSFGISLVGISTVMFGLIDRSPPGMTFLAMSLIFRILDGVGSVAVKVACFIIMESLFKRKYAELFAALDSCVGIGIVVGPTVGGLLYEIGGFVLPFMVTGGVLLIDNVVIVFLLPTTKIKTDKPKPKLKLKDLANVGLILYALVIFYSYTIFGFNAAVLEPHIRQFNLTPFQVGTVFIISGGTYFIATPFGRWLCKNKVNPKMFIFVGCVLMLTELVFIGPLTFVPFQSQLSWIITMLFLQGFGGSIKLVCGYIEALKAANGNKCCENDLRCYTVVSSLFSIAVSMGGFVGPAVGSYISYYHSYRRATDIFMCGELVVTLLIVVYYAAKLLGNFLGKSEEPSTEKTPLLLSTKA